MKGLYIAQRVLSSSEKRSSIIVKNRQDSTEHGVKGKKRGKGGEGRRLSSNHAATLLLLLITLLGRQHCANGRVEDVLEPLLAVTLLVVRETDLVKDSRQTRGFEVLDSTNVPCEGCTLSILNRRLPPLAHLLKGSRVFTKIELGPHKDDGSRRRWVAISKT